MSCLMNFGELNIPSSRAFWDDCEEDEVPTEQPESLKIVYEPGFEDSPINSDIFLVVEGINITDFANKTLLNDSKKVCTIPPKKSKSSLYFNSTKKHLLAILEEDLTNSGEVTELLLPYARLAQQVITITLKPKVEYKSEHIKKYSESISIVREVNSKLNHVEELEAPNFIVGTAAGIATARENDDLPTSSYIVYTDKLPLDATAAKPVIKLLHELGIECAANYTPARKDDSYLYM